VGESSTVEQKLPEPEKKSLANAGIKKPLIDVAKYAIDPNILKLIPKDLASKHFLIPLYQSAQVLFVAMANPKDIKAIDEVRHRTQLHAIIPLFAPKEDIQTAIDRHYSQQEKVQDILQAVQKEKLEEGEALQFEKDEKKQDLAALAEQAPVIKLVNHVILQAINEKASDIHIEPDEKVLRVRYRIDGILRENYVFEKDLESSIVARVKITAGMDIAEKRKPQDGRIRFRLENKQIDVRVSSLPTIYGENLVLRLLDKTSVKKDLKSLGMDPSILTNFEKIIQTPYGVVLVTGPTGSGKSTTLYGALNTVNDMDKNIVTVEDPVEYDLELIRQTQVNPKVGLTFAVGLRSILRQDPDIIMVGEIRDPETAEIAVQAALTGHLVFSTLHTNDACGAVTRLMDMGVQPFLIASSLVGVLGQRLVRRICTHCKELYVPPPALIQELGLEESVDHFYVGRGCKECHSLGYAGRTAIHELLTVTPEIRNLITARATQSDIQKLALSQGMRTLRQAGLEKARQGITTLQEVIKVTA